MVVILICFIQSLVCNHVNFNLHSIIINDTQCPTFNRYPCIWTINCVKFNQIKRSNLKSSTYRKFSKDSIYPYFWSRQLVSIRNCCLMNQPKKCNECYVSYICGKIRGANITSSLSLTHTQTLSLSLSLSLSSLISWVSWYNEAKCFSLKEKYFQEYCT